MRDTITNSDDIIDSRDIAARIAELEDSQDEDDQTELAMLQSLVDQYSGSEWEYGVTLIRETYFADYAEEFAKDVSDIPVEAFDAWPMNCIDWEQAASELQMNYVSLDFDGVTYYAR